MTTTHPQKVGTMTTALRRYGRSYTSADLQAQYDTQLAELPAKIAAKPGWTSHYMNDVETLRGRVAALAEIEKEFDGIEKWAVEKAMLATEMLLFKFDVVAEYAVDAAASLATGTIETAYYKGRYEIIRDVWKHLRRDPWFPGNTTTDEKEESN
jgi:hypothetical protein